MPFKTPTLKELIDEVEGLYAARIKAEEMPISEQKIRARQLAYVCHKNLIYVSYMGEQIVPTTADEEYLEKHCEAKGIFRKQASYAYGAIYGKGYIVGAILPAGSVLIRKPDNMRYEVTQNVVMTGERQEIPVKCLTPGVAGNAKAGEVLEFSVTLAGIENSAEVKLIGSGADIETKKDLLVRYLITIRNVFYGGADTDYIKWALSVEGVNNAWAEGCTMGVGTVTVWIMTPIGVPDTVLCQKVRTFIETVRPVTVKRIFVTGLNEKTVTITITGLTPDNDSLRALIEVSLLKYFKGLKKGEKVKLKDVYDAITAVQGVENYHIDLVNDIEVAANEIAVLGGVAWA